MSARRGGGGGLGAVSVVGGMVALWTVLLVTKAMRGRAAAAEPDPGPEAVASSPPVEPDAPPRRPRRGLWPWAAAVIASTAALSALLVSWQPPGPASAGTLPIAEAGTAKRFAAGPLVRLSDITAGAPVGTHPAGADRLAPDRTVPPVAVRIDALGIDVPVLPVGVETESGAMAVPPDGGIVGWYQYGPSPGERGSAVLAGHVDFDGRPGAFFELRSLEPGAVIVVRTAEGAERPFLVQGRAEIAKSDLPVADVFARTGPPALVLVTCGGTYDRATRSYSSNVVVYALPA